MSAAKLSSEIAEQILRLINDTALANPGLALVANGHHKSVQAYVINILAKGGIPRDTLRSRLHAVRTRWPEQWEAAGRGALETATPAAETFKPRSLAEDVDLDRARRTAGAATSQLRASRARIAELEDQVRNYKWASNLSLEPVEWTLPRLTGGASREHIPHLFTSDFQCGEVIRADETDAGYGYDHLIFGDRYRKLIETTIELCLHHHGGMTYPGIIYARGGDSISGAIHDDLSETDDLKPLEAVQLVFETERAGIKHLLEAFGRVEIKETEEGGNHGRTTVKPRSKRASAYSLESMISYLLRVEFGRDDRITIQTSKSPDVRYNIFNRRILQTHGDKTGSRGGQGFVGPAATILRGGQKVIAEQQRLNRIIDEVHMGHFHTSLDMGMVLSNGSLPGYSEYAKSMRMVPELPCQWLSIYHPTYGAILRRRIFLLSPEEIATKPRAAFSGKSD